jgi:hypothetical protein
MLFDLLAQILFSEMVFNQPYKQKLKQIIASKGFGKIDMFDMQKFDMQNEPFDLTNISLSPKEVKNGDLNCFGGCDFLVAFLPQVSSGKCIKPSHAKNNQ